MTIAATQPIIKNTPVSKERTYILYYHFKSTQPLNLIFEFAGTFHEAIDRGKLHCERVGYRFIKVRPFIVDLDERESRIQDSYMED